MSSPGAISVAFSSLLANLARAKGELGSMSLTDLSLLRAQAEQDLVSFGPRFELVRQRRLAMRVQNLREHYYLTI